ncbi:uncharacterized protein LOC111875343 [Cryptotermes secundus]|uniref:uncharacterized protein LOC111875343 n=1 Tax=Cryptotermes secundus TaxID=105785 RepID=UPI000CD7B09D|nr:uncharacterized protein LOC111875343 [Cryptotermes secundus]
MDKGALRTFKALVEGEHNASAAPGTHPTVLMAIPVFILQRNCKEDSLQQIHGVRGETQRSMKGNSGNLFLQKSVMTYNSAAMTDACPTWEHEADAHLLKLQCQQKFILRATGNLDRLNCRWLSKFLMCMTI